MYEAISKGYSSMYNDRRGPPCMRDGGVIFAIFTSCLRYGTLICLGTFSQILS